MEPLQIKNIIIGDGIPKICVPVTASTLEELKSELKGLDCDLLDIIEWRVDCFFAFKEQKSIKEVLAYYREVMGDIPLLFTFRTKREGGKSELEKEEYIALLNYAIESKLVDIIDIEYWLPDGEKRTLIKLCKFNDVKTIISSHDFNGTPSVDMMVEKMEEMIRLGADLPKIAVMPNRMRDVTALLEATVRIKEVYSGQPIITMSMGQLGMVSRITGEVFGSAVTFGSGNVASAPGQIEVQKLREILGMVHRIVE